MASSMLDAEVGKATLTSLRQRNHSAILPLVVEPYRRDVMCRTRHSRRLGAAMCKDLIGVIAMSLKALSIVVVALAASTPAMADSGIEFVNNEIGCQLVHPTPSTTTRARVVAELQAARQAGAIPQSYEFPAALRSSTSKQTRAQVRADRADTTVGEHEAVHRVYGPDHAFGS